MIIIVLMIVKMTATLFAFVFDSLLKFWAPSVPMLFAWASDPFSTMFFAFKSDLWFALFVIYLLAWLVTPWLTISNRSTVKIVGLSFVICFNLFDIIGCMLSLLSIADKICNLLFSILVICLSIWSICREKGIVGSTREDLLGQGDGSVS